MPPKSTTAPVKPKVRFIKPLERRGEIGRPTGKEPDAIELEFGFWDNAVEVQTIPMPGSSGVKPLHDEEREERNLVGGDSRRFYIVVEDLGAAGKQFVEVHWWTAYKDSDERIPGIVQDDPQSPLTLFETKAGSGVFVSNGLMLVNDAVDRRIAIHSGISPSHPKLGKAHGGVRSDTMSNYRVRRAGMFSFGVASYQNKGMKAPETVMAPVFAPGNRRLLPVQVYVVRKTKGSDAAIPVADLAATDLRVVKETYERHGIWLFTALSPPDLLVPGTTVEKSGAPITFTVLVVDPPAKVGNAQVNDTGIDELARVFPAMTNTLRLFFVEKLLFFPPVLGISFGPSYNPNAPTPDENNPVLVLPPKPMPPGTVGTTAVQAARDPYTAAHELGHVLVDKPLDKNTGHYTEPFSISKPGERHVQQLNLMFPSSRGTTEGPFQVKRIWDMSDGDGDDQIVKLTLSRFVH